MHFWTFAHCLKLLLLEWYKKPKWPHMPFPSFLSQNTKIEWKLNVWCITYKKHFLCCFLYDWIDERYSSCIVFSEMIKEKIFSQIDYIFLTKILFRYSVPIYSYLPIYPFIYHTSTLILLIYIIAIIWMQKSSAVKNTIISAIKVQIEVGCILQIHNKNVMMQQILWNWVLHG